MIEGTKGLFVAMPSLRMKETCSRCGHRNVVRSKYCNQCGTAYAHHREPAAGAGHTEENRQAEHKDIAHPITAACREYLQQKILQAYEKQVRLMPEDERALARHEDEEYSE